LYGLIGLEAVEDVAMEVAASVGVGEVGAFAEEGAQQMD
jgi:hypothetical protein